MKRLTCCLGASLLMLACSTANAGLVTQGYFSDFRAQFSSTSYDLQSFHNNLNAHEVLAATEVSSLPTANRAIGDTLTFANQGIRLRATQVSNFVYDDNEAPFSWGSNHLSIGDINNEENDNFVIDVLRSDVYYLAINVLGNSSRSRSSEILRVTLADGTVTNFYTDSPRSSLGSGNDRIDFFSLVSDTPILNIWFNEDNGGDDIALASYSFGTVTPRIISAVPAPGPLGLMVLGLIALLSHKRIRARTA